MRRLVILGLTSLVSLSLAGLALAQTEAPPPLTPAEAPGSTSVVTEAPKSPPALSAPTTPAGISKPGSTKPSVPTVGTPEIAVPAAGIPEPAEPVTAGPVSPANEPSVLPPSDGLFIPEPESDPPISIEVPDIGPGSMSQPIISGARDDRPVRVAQPVPVMELSLFFGAVLLLAAVYLSYTARHGGEDEGPEQGPRRP